ncbi:Guanine deaminase, partial [Globisporangium polare]
TAQSGQQRQFDYKDAFWVATMGGAAALGIENDTGSFAEGKCFDAVLVDVDASGSTLDFSDRDSRLDVFQKLIHNGDSRNFVKVFVKGRVVHSQETRG